MAGDRIPNPFVMGRGGMTACIPARVCRVLEAELGAQLAQLRTRARGVDPELSGALAAVREAAMSFVPPEEQVRDRSSEQAAVSEWLSSTEAAGLLRVKPRAVTQAIARGRLPAEWVGRSWRIRRAEVVRYREARSA